MAENSLAIVGEEIIVAAPLLESVCQNVASSGHQVVSGFKGADLAGTICSHPFRGQGYDFDVPALAASFVEMDTGSGFVHIAPGHGFDDWVLGVENGLAIPETVMGDGVFADHVPLLAAIMCLSRISWLSRS